MLRTYVYERTYVLLKYDPRLKYSLCYDPLKTTSMYYRCVNVTCGKNLQKLQRSSQHIAYYEGHVSNSINVNNIPKVFSDIKCIIQIEKKIILDINKTLFIIFQTSKIQGLYLK